MACEIPQKFYRTLDVLVDRSRSAVVKFDFGIQIVDVAQLLGDGMGGKDQPYGIIGKVFVLNGSVKEGTGRIAVFVLIGQNAAKTLGGQLGIDASQALGIAGQIAKTVVTHSGPTGTHVGLVLEPVIEKVVEVIPGRMDVDLAANVLILFLQTASLLPRG